MNAGRSLYGILALLCAAAYAWIGWHLLFPQHGESTFSVCLFKTVTGLPCPSCGTTRSVLLLLGGEVHRSIMLNPLGIIAALALAVTPAWILADLLTKKKTLAPLLLWTEKKIRSKKVIFLPLAALVLLNWGWNILKDL